MTITCPSCTRKFRLEDFLVKVPYQKMRCSLCGHVFVYERAGSRYPEDGEPVTALDEPEERPLEKKRWRGLPISAIIFAVLLVLVASAYYFYWINYPGASDRRLRIGPMEGQETVIKDGKVFLVKGLIANGSTKPRKYVILKAKLFDEHGAVMAEHFALAGLPLSSDEVQQMRSGEIDRKVADFRLSSLANFVLQKGRELPFSVVFPDTYTGKPKEFTVEIIESPLL
ncbi:MAG: zinc-ribbon domain-containing protein [Syntrophorhabdales bacterium]